MPVQKKKFVSQFDSIQSLQILPSHDIIPHQKNHHHSNETKARALILKSQGFSYARIAEMLNINSSVSVHYWCNGKDIDKDLFLSVSEEIRESIPKMLMNVGNEVVNLSMEPERIAEASSKDLAVMASIYFEKAQLLGGGATENIAIHYTKGARQKSQVSEMDSKLARLEKLASQFDS